VVLASRLRAALERLNPTLPPEAITTALDEFCAGPWMRLRHFALRAR
jgi:hypothetical protein